MKIYFQFVYDIPKVIMKQLVKDKLIKRKCSVLGVCKTGYINNEKTKTSFIEVNLREEYMSYENKLINSICETVQHEHLHALIHQHLNKHSKMYEEKVVEEIIGLSK